MNEQPLPETGGIGPGAWVDEGIAPKPMLEGATEGHYVDVLNPMTEAFVGQFGVTRPVQADVTVGPTMDGQKMSEAEAVRVYGVPKLTNPAKSGQTHIINQVRIPAGETIRLLGSEAQVIVRQLVTLMMQLEGKKGLLADKFARHQVEKRIVISIGSIADIMGRNPVTVSEQMRNALKNNPLEQLEAEAVPEKPAEVEFPDAQPTSEPEPQLEQKHILVENKPRVTKKRGRPRTKTA